MAFSSFMSKVYRSEKAKLKQRKQFRNLVTLHNELPCSQEAVLGPQFVSVLGRNLVEVDGQLAEGKLVCGGENLRHCLFLCLDL